MSALRLLPELEDALRHIQGVKAASVVTGPDAVPTEVHVLASPGKPAKQVVRDVQSLALARYDIDIDHRIVSVVQMGDDDVRAPEQASDTRAGRCRRRRGQRRDRRTTVDRGDHGAQRQGRDRGVGHPRSRRPALRGPQPGAGGPQPPGPAGGDRNAGRRGRAARPAVRGRVRRPSSPPGPARWRSPCSPWSSRAPASRCSPAVPAVRGDEADAVARSVLAALNRQLAG